MLENLDDAVNEEVTPAVDNLNQAASGENNSVQIVESSESNIAAMLSLGYIPVTATTAATVIPPIGTFSFSEFE